MSVVQKDIVVKLQTTIDDQGMKEENEVLCKGTFYKKGTMDVLIFDEMLDEELKVKNLVTIQESSVNIKRTGPVSMNQKFDINRRTEGIYKHPHGSLHMETWTNRIVYKQKGEADGQLILSYRVKLNGHEDERKHELILSFQEEATK